MDGDRKKFYSECSMGSDTALSVPVGIRKDTLVSFGQLLSKVVRDMQELITEIDDILEEKDETTPNQ